MKLTTSIGLALIIAGTAAAADVTTNNPVKEAITKLKDAPNYAWTATIQMPGAPFTPGPVKGKAEKGGFALMSQEMNENTVEVAVKGGKAAVKTEDGWKLVGEAEGFQAMMAGFLTRTGPAAQEAEDLSKKAQECKPSEGGLFSADFTDLLRWRAFSFCLLRLIWDLMFATREPR